MTREAAREEDTGGCFMRCKCLGPGYRSLSVKNESDDLCSTPNLDILVRLGQHGDRLQTFPSYLDATEEVCRPGQIR